MLLQHARQIEELACAEFCGSLFEGGACREFSHTSRIVSCGLCSVSELTTVVTPCSSLSARMAASTGGSAPKGDQLLMEHMFFLQKAHNTVCSYALGRRAQRGRGLHQVCRVTIVLSISVLQTYNIGVARSLLANGLTTSCPPASLLRAGLPRAVPTSRYCPNSHQTGSVSRTVRARSGLWIRSRKRRRHRADCPFGERKSEISKEQRLRQLAT